LFETFQILVLSGRVQTIGHVDFSRVRAGVVPGSSPLAPVAGAPGSAQASDSGHALESAQETGSSPLAFQTVTLLEYKVDEEHSALDMFELSPESAFLAPQFFHFALMSALYGQRTYLGPFASVSAGPCLYPCPDLLDPDVGGHDRDLSLNTKTFASLICYMIDMQIF